MVFSSMLLLLFLIVFMLDTMPQYRLKPHWPRIAENINMGTAVYFGVEWLLRFYAFQNPKRYLLEPLSLIDLLSVVPAYASYDTSLGTSFGRAKWLRALQILRILRIMRVAEYSVELYVIVRTLKKSLTQILIVMLVIAIVLLTACFLMFFSENDTLDVGSGQWMRKNRGVVEVSPFQNVFYCLYWGFVTVTTVGYGDLTPVSPWGQVVACLTMVMGVFTVVFPTSIISTNFANEWEAFHKAQKLHQKSLLRRDTENRRLQLARIWSDANRDYDAMLTEAIHANVARSDPELNKKTPSLDQPNDASAPDIGLRQATRVDFSQPALQNLPAEPPQFGWRQHKMAPFEYHEMMKVIEKVEKDLGIPKMDMNEIEESSEINQKLLINAIHSKLYNDAYSLLCERLLFCLSEFRRFESSEDLAGYLQNLDIGHGHPANSPPMSRKKKMTSLEYKLMSFVFEKVSLRIDPDTASMSPRQSSKFHINQQQYTTQQHLDEHFGYSSADLPHTSDANSFSGMRTRFHRSRRNLAHKVKSRLRHGSNYAPISRTPTGQAAHQRVASSYTLQNRLPLRRPRYEDSPVLSRVASEMRYENVTPICQVHSGQSAGSLEGMQPRLHKPAGLHANAQVSKLNSVSGVMGTHRDQEGSGQVAIDMPSNGSSNSSSDPSSSSGDSDSREAFSIRRHASQGQHEVTEGHDADDEYNTN
ncbi:voltage-gated potassium channel [Linderina pennispora]|uniref:Voltage-gated potassium channel n=1 Tax=Linderina pennispora TaxID=61395 RepID=A0A1Y1WBK8_9FUNG|nr:voltage-gated potassium channel [Linderina pennispora]ORX70822.1 voltage-gated potassium channel [Linderina pennispora]